MKISAWKPTLVIVSLLLTLTYLWMQSTRPELDQYKHWQAKLRLIELRDAELMRDVLLVRAGLLVNYDALTLSGQNLVQLSQSLQAELDPVGTQLANLAGNLTNAVQQKLALIEYLKSDNALLRNSIMYFEDIGKTLPNGTKRVGNEVIGNLWQLMFSFLQAPEPELAKKVEQTLDQLTKNTAQSKSYQGLIPHGRLIIELLPKVDALLREVIDKPLNNQVDALQRAFNDYSARLEARAQTYRLLLYLVALLLVGYLLYQYLRLRTFSLDLQRSHSYLLQETAERLQAEAALKENEARLRAITDSAHEAIVSADSWGNVMSWNRGASLMFGYSANQALGKPFINLLAKPAEFNYTEYLTKQDPNLVSNTTSSVLAITGVRYDGHEFPLELSLSSWVRGRSIFLTAIIRDISVRKRLEEVGRQQELQLIQANKMTALGTLVSGVAHEINNPNQLILFNSGLLADVNQDVLEILQEQYELTGEFTLAGLPYSEMRTALPILIHDINDGAKRIERIVADLKNYVRPQNGKSFLSVSLNDVVERSVRLLKHLISSKTDHFNLHLAESLVLIQGDPQQLGQVVVNLLVNALDALADKQKAVTVSTFMTDNGSHVCLEVRDEGIGIAEEHLEQLCDPFFTTKQASGGTGLGLAISASLVHAHRGRLSFSSTLGQGSIVQAIFPVSQY